MRPERQFTFDSNIAVAIVFSLRAGFESEAARFFFFSKIIIFSIRRLESLWCYSALVLVPEYGCEIFENVNNKQIPYYFVAITVVPHEIDTTRFQLSAKRSELFVCPVGQFSL